MTILYYKFYLSLNANMKMLQHTMPCVWFRFYPENVKVTWPFSSEELAGPESCDIQNEFFRFQMG